MSVGIKNQNKKKKNIKKLILLRKWKHMDVMAKIFLKMLGTLSKILSFLNLCLILRRRKVGKIY